MKNSKLNDDVIKALIMAAAGEDDCSAQGVAIDFSRVQPGSKTYNLARIFESAYRVPGSVSEFNPDAAIEIARSEFEKVAGKHQADADVDVFGVFYIALAKRVYEAVGFKDYVQQRSLQIKSIVAGQDFHSTAKNNRNEAQLMYIDEVPFVSSPVVIPPYNPLIGQAAHRYLRDMHSVLGSEEFCDEELWKVMAAGQIGPSITKQQYQDLQGELESINLSYAQGQDMPGMDERHEDICRLMSAAPWVLSNEIGGVISRSAENWLEVDRCACEQLNFISAFQKAELINLATEFASKNPDCSTTDAAVFALRELQRRWHTRLRDVPPEWDFSYSHDDLPGRHSLAVQQVIDWVESMSQDESPALNKPKMR